MVIAARNSIAFLLGLGFAFLPAYGPFLSLLFIFSARWTLRRSDVLWWAAAFLLALPLAIHQGIGGFLFGALQILAPWLIYRAFSNLVGKRLFCSSGGLLSLGLLVGLALIVGLGGLRLEAPDLSAGSFLKVAWPGNPALYGHTAFVLGALIAIIVSDSRIRLVSLAVSAIGILISGSREAAIAWLIVAAALCLADVQRARGKSLLEAVLLGVMLLAAVGLGPLLGWQREGFLVNILPSSKEQTNLIQDSELPQSSPWEQSGLHMQSSSVSLAGQKLTAYRLGKTSPEASQRLQQAVSLEANTPYVLSVWIKQPKASTVPGVQGWGQAAGEAAFKVTGSLVGGQWRASLSGPGQLLGSGSTVTNREWQRVWISFSYQGRAAPLKWWVGLAPDQQQRTGTSATFAGFQLEQGTAPSAYVPGAVSGGLSLSVARLPYWQAAYQGALKKPLWGWGQGAFPNYYRTHRPASDKLQETPSHAHNLFLQIFFARGAVGILGLLLLLGSLTQAAYRKRDLAFLTVLAAILLANVFDYTLFYGGIIYPLAAVAGWRAATYQGDDRRQDSITRQLAVRFTLAAMDFAVALLAFSAAIGIRRLAGSWLGLAPLVFPEHFGSTMRYAFLLWPAVAWFEGLYPGYGLTPPQELKKQVLGVLYAGLILAAGTVLFYKELPIPRSVLILTVLVSILLNPSGRALIKRGLFHLGLWGRPVVILGAGQTGRRVAKALLNRPLDGLAPSAFFDDDPAKRGLELDGLVVQGSLPDAFLSAPREGVRHAIVAIPHLSAEALAPLTGAGARAFRQIQFVPDLRGMPVYGVSASSLDNLLALEVHNALASPLNRAFKRALDLVAVGVGGLLVSPLLLALALAVRFDTPGPIFFGHQRLGHGGKAFTCWKFRTMVPHAEELLTAYLRKHPELRREWEETHKLQHDPRITRVGKFLRKYSLDELPQLWNVFLGQMSLVGPRPIVRAEIGKYADSYELYKQVRPGMAGLWQVSGRSDMDYAGRVALDSFYVRNWSVWLDITILTAIPRVVLEGDGAY